MRCRVALWSALLVTSPFAATADVLITRDGLQIETQGAWEVKSRVVVFTNIDGALSSMRLSEIDLEASAKATHDAAEAAKAAEEEAEHEPTGPQNTSPLTRAILDAYGDEEKNSVLELGHDDISGKDWQDFRRAVGAALQDLEKIRREYDLQNPEGMRRAGSGFARAAAKLRQVLLKPMPRRQETIEGRKAVEAMADYLEQLAQLAADDPHMAIQVLNQGGGLG